MKNSYSYISIFILAVASIVGITYFVKHKNAKPIQSDTQVIRELIENKQVQKESVLSTPEIEKLKQKDWDYLASVLHKPGKPQERLEFIKAILRTAQQYPAELQASIDVTKTYNEFYRFISSNKYNYRGKLSRPINFSVQILSTFPAPEKDGEAYRGLVELITDQTIDLNLREATLSLISNWSTLPEGISHYLDKTFTSSNPEEANVAMNTLIKMADNERRTTLVKSLRSKFKNIHPGNRPNALKIIFSNSHLFKPDEMVSQLNAIKDSKDEKIQEVFLIGIESIGGATNYLKELDSIARTSSNPFLKQKAQVLATGKVSNN
jgi:hypothetical protein